MDQTKTNSTVGKRYLPWNPKSVSRTRQDIKSWNNALNMARLAEHPQNYALQLIYDECDLDGLITAQWNNRKNQIFSASFSLKNASGDVDEEQTKILKKHPLYRKLSNAALDSIMFGYNVGEFKFKKVAGEMKLRFDLIPRYNVVPQTGMFYPEYGDPSKFIKYREIPEFGIWVLEFNSENLGLMNKLVPMALLTRFTEASWSELGEIYGIPPRVMKTNTQDATMLKRAEAMMRDMGSAAWFIIDETEEFEFAKGVSTNGDVYNNLLKHCGAKICNMISGGMIGQDTQNGARAKDEVSMEMLWLLVQSDMAMLEEEWNETIIPALVKHGVLPEGLSFEFDETEDIAQLWKFVQGLLPFFDIDPEWIKDKFGIEIIGAKAQNDLATTLALALKGAVPPPTGGAGGGEGDPDFFLRAPLDGACCGAHHINPLLLQGELEGALSLPKDAPKSSTLIKRVGEANGELTFDLETFRDTAKTLTKGFNKKLDGRKIKLAKSPRSVSSQTGRLAMDFAYGIDSPHLLAAFEMNLFRFSAGKTLAQVQALNQAFRDAPSFDIFRMNANRIGDVFNERWLRTEFDTAVLVGESSATYHSLMRDVDVFPYWEYRTAGDALVREEHAALDGLILPANDPRWAKIFPPNGWNCRCYIVARTRAEAQGINFQSMQERADTYFGSEDFERAVKSGFGINRAVTGEVFTANQQYITGRNLTQSTKLINELEPKDYGLRPSAELIQNATRKLPTPSGGAGGVSDTVEQFVADLDTLNGKSVIRDYNQRALNFPLDASKGIQLLEAVRDTLSNPSELWAKVTKGGYQLTYLTYYEGEAFQVIAEMAGLELNLVSWSKVKNIESKRKGMLLK